MLGVDERLRRQPRPVETPVLPDDVLPERLGQLRERGLAGLNETAVSAGRLQPSIMAGYGYTAIVVAWLARLNPLAIGLAALFVAGLRVGVEALQLSLQVPAAFGGIMEGLILLTVLAGQFATNFRFRIDRGPR